MKEKKEYVAYVDEYGSVLIDFDNDNFEHAYPYTTKNLTELERGHSVGGPELVAIHARLKKKISAHSAKKFELFMGCLGNGITVFNKAVMEHGDYKMVAHISPEGELKWYVAPGYTPAGDAIRIRREADMQRNKYEEWWQSLSPEKRYELKLERMSPAELVEHIRKRQEEKKNEVLP